jgi:hypothetical protein
MYIGRHSEALAGLRHTIELDPDRQTQITELIESMLREYLEDHHGDFPGLTELIG